MPTPVFVDVFHRQLVEKDHEVNRWPQLTKGM
jgi:hypothetical protein